MLLLDGTAPTGPSSFLQWLDSLIDGRYTSEALLAISSIAAIVWTAGFVVRTLGHRPGLGLVAAMNYAQLAFMGGLVATFLTPVALQAVAVLFLIQAIWTICGVIITSRLPFDQRTFGQQQMLTTLGLADGKGLGRYLFFELLYLFAIVVILVWPNRIVVLPLGWLALYGSYQILISFLYTPPESQQSATSSPVAPAVQPNAVLTSMIGTQNSIQALLDTTTVATGVFAGRPQDVSEARAMVMSMQESSASMVQFDGITHIIKPIGSLVASGYLHALLSHRAAMARLYALVFGVDYAPGAAASLIDEIRPLGFYDQPAYSGKQTLQFATQGEIVNIVIKDASVGSTTRTYALAWLGDVYCAEATTSLLSVLKALSTPLPPAPATALPPP